MKLGRFTQSAALVAKVLLVGSSTALLGAACWEGVQTNTNVASLNGNVNTGTNENTNPTIQNSNAVKSNSNVSTNTNSVSNTNSEVNTNISSVDTSDWLTYTNQEYGFSLRYPGDWVVNIEETKLGSRIFEDNSIYVIQFLENDELKLAVLPEGQVDHGFGSDIQVDNIVIDNKPVTVLSSDAYQVYKFDNFPQKDSEFRTESRVTNALENLVIQEIVMSIDFTS